MEAYEVKGHKEGKSVSVKSAELYFSVLCYRKEKYGEGNKGEPTENTYFRKGYSKPCEKSRCAEQ